MSPILLPAVIFLAVALVLVAGAVAFLALELRWVRCGKIHPKVLESLPDRFATVPHSPRTDYTTG